MDYKNGLQTYPPSKTRVLLVNVYNLNGETITHDIYYRLFSRYGKVLRILIFEKSKVWKAFVELETPQQAERAKNALHETPILIDGSKLNIFYSDLDKINLQNSNTGGVDYTTLSKENIRNYQTGMQPTKSSILTPVVAVPSQNSSEIKKFPTFPLYESHKASYKSSQPSEKISVKKTSADEDGDQIIFLTLKSLGIEPKDLDDNSSEKQDDLPSFSNDDHSSFNDEENFEFPKENLNKMIEIISNEIDTFDNGKFPSKDTKGKKSLKLNSTPFKGSSIEDILSLSPKKDVLTPNDEDVFEKYVNPLFLIENKKSKVIFIKNLDVSKANGQKLCNLFGCFGNIEKVLLLKSKNAALIEYSSVDQATQGKDYMNKKILFGKEIKIFYSNYESIDKKHINKDKAIEELYQNSKENYRYKAVKPSILNPPSKVLHISNLKMEAQQHLNVLQMIFSMHGAVEGIKFLDPDLTSKKPGKKNKVMCLVKFYKLEDSFSALSELHGRECFGKLKISFTRSLF